MVMARARSRESRSRRRAESTGGCSQAGRCVLPAYRLETGTAANPLPGTGPSQVIDLVREPLPHDQRFGADVWPRESLEREQDWRRQSRWLAAHARVDEQYGLYGQSAEVADRYVGQSNHQRGGAKLSRRPPGPIV